MQWWRKGVCEKEKCLCAHGNVSLPNFCRVGLYYMVKSAFRVPRDFMDARYISLSSPEKVCGCLRLLYSYY